MVSKKIFRLNTLVLNITHQCVYSMCAILVEIMFSKHNIISNIVSVTSYLQQTLT